MSLSFFDDMTEISNYIFYTIRLLWNSIMSNWITMLSFAIFILGSIVAIIRRIKNIKS